MHIFPWTLRTSVDDDVKVVFLSLTNMLKTMNMYSLLGSNDESTSDFSLVDNLRTRTFTYKPRDYFCDVKAFFCISARAKTLVFHSKHRVAQRCHQVRKCDENIAKQSHSVYTWRHLIK